MTDYPKILFAAQRCLPGEKFFEPDPAGSFISGCVISALEIDYVIGHHHLLAGWLHPSFANQSDHVCLLPKSREYQQTVYGRSSAKWFVTHGERRTLLNCSCIIFQAHFVLEPPSSLGSADSHSMCILSPSSSGPKNITCSCRRLNSSTLFALLSSSS